MFGFNYYHGTLRKYVIYFGTLFNQIYIDRVDVNGNVVQTIRVPITYGPRDKVLSRVSSDPNLNRPFSSILPYITFQITSMSFDEERHLNNLNYQVGHNLSNKNLASFVYSPSPIDIDFELNVMVKTFEDGVRVMEQILPFFQPDWTSTLKLIDNPDVRRDIPVVLKKVSSSDTWDGNFDKRQVITFTLEFTMRALFFGPVSKNRVIKKANVNFGTTDGFIDEIITVTPGLTANGQPTTDPAQTIDWSEIDWDDDYDFIIKTEVSDIYGKLE